MRINKKFIIITTIFILVTYFILPFWNLGNSTDFDEKNRETWFDEKPHILKKVTVFQMLRVKDGMLLEDAIKILGKPQEQWGSGETYLVWDTKYVLKYTIRVATAEIVNEEGIGEMRLVIDNALLVPQSQKP